MAWAFYPAFFATGISILGLTRLAYAEYNNATPRTLSELAAQTPAVYYRFRNILLVCGLLFAVTLYAFIVPRAPHMVLLLVFGTMMIAGELLASLVLASGKTLRLHNIIARTMAVGMFGLALIYWSDFNGVYRLFEIAFSGLMLTLGLLTIFDSKRFIFYELPFIFASHLSILIAALALR